MFPTQSDGPVLEDPSIFEQLDTILDDQLADYAALEGNEFTDTGVKKRPRKTSSESEIQENEGSYRDLKKTVHREIERQRRKEMAGLYASLRSLLPLEYIKGKRAISDHMHQAVNYIKDMQKKMEEMKMRRDKLKKQSAVAGVARDAKNPNSNISDSPNCVRVNHWRDGMEIIISSSLNERCFPLSKVIVDLLGRGLDVISCDSTRGDRCFLHKLEIELNDPPRIDLSELHERLVNVIQLA